jgi:predicted RNase H-like nuclease (RuvC/YqgF family)
MSNTQDNKHKEELVDYRLDKLERGFEQIANILTELKNIVVRWDERFDKANFSPLTCQMHSEKILQFTNKLNAIEKDVDELKAYLHKTIGALVIISIVFQLVGPIIVDKLHGESTSKQHIEKVEEQ